MAKERQARVLNVMTESLREAGFQAVAGIRFPGAHVMEGHIAKIEPGVTKPAHRHINEAVLYVVQGQGYSTVKPLGEAVETKVEWQTGSVFFVPSMALHGHTNTGSTPVRLLASYPRGPGMFFLYEKAIRESDPVLIDQLGLPQPELVRNLLDTEEELLEARTREMLRRVFRS